MDYKTLDAEAAAVPIGCEGLVAQEHLQAREGLAFVLPPRDRSCAGFRFREEEPFQVLLYAFSIMPLGCLSPQGNRTPHTDPLSRGALVGLTLRHGAPLELRTIVASLLSLAPFAAWDRGGSSCLLALPGVCLLC